MIIAVSRRVGRAGVRTAAFDQRGLSDSLPWTLLTPVLLLAVLGTIQAGILMHGHNVAENAAQAAAQAESAYQAGGSGLERAVAIAAAGGLTDVRVAVRRGPAKVEVEVTARIRSSSTSARDASPRSPAHRSSG